MPTGRPTELTTPVADVLVKATADGLPRRLAADLAGVAPRTLYRWLARGRDGDGDEFVQFWHRVKKAQAEHVLKRLKAIQAAGAKSWQAHAWYLERTHPDLFGLSRGEVAALRKELAAAVAHLARPGPPGVG